MCGSNTFSKAHVKILKIEHAFKFHVLKEEKKINKSCFTYNKCILHEPI